MSELLRLGSNYKYKMMEPVLKLRDQLCSIMQETPLGTLRGLIQLPR